MNYNFTSSLCEQPEVRRKHCNSKVNMDGFRKGADDQSDWAAAVCKSLLFIRLVTSSSVGVT